MACNPHVAARGVSQAPEWGKLSTAVSLEEPFARHPDQHPVKPRQGPAMQAGRSECSHQEVGQEPILGSVPPRAQCPPARSSTATRCGESPRAAGAATESGAPQSPSVPFRKFDEEVLRTLRGLRPHPLPPGLDDQAAVTAVSGGEALRSLHCAVRSTVQVPLRAAPRGEDLMEAGDLRPPASFKTSPLPRLDSLLGTLTRAGGGPPLTCTALRAARRKCRYGLLREGQGWGRRTTTAVRHAPVARP
jgi:hypothetical protein